MSRQKSVKQSDVDLGKMLADARQQGPLTERIVDAVWEIWRTSKVMYNPLRQAGMTPEKFWILRTLYTSGDRRIKDIAAQIGTTSSPVTISVKRLESEGLVKRERGTEDERIVTVRLTGKGVSVFESLREGRRKAIASLFNLLDEREKSQLFSLLEKVLASSTQTEASSIAPLSSQKRRPGQRTRMTAFR
jgi:MarR family transcriptional regulator, organic hydroperoxide resistance regulator